MPQIKLNDPNAPGGSTAFNLEYDQGCIGTFNAPILQRWGDAINANFAELYALVGNQLPSSNLTAYSASVPLDSNYHMPRQVVTSQLAFTAAAGATGAPTAISGCTVELVADGNEAHIPTFPGFTPVSTSSGWVNTAGTVNRCSFVYDGTTYTMAIWQGGLEFPLGTPVIAPAVTSISLVHGENPLLVLGIGGSGLNPAYIPPIGAFSVSGADGVQLGNGDAVSNQIVVTSNSVSVPLLGTVAAGDTISVGYTPPTTWVRTASGPLQDANGVLMGAITAATVTAS